MLYALFPFLILFLFAAMQARRQVNCPRCDARFSSFSSPFKKTRRMWREGGYLCAECGCETDLAGNEVTAGTPVKSQYVSLVIALLLAGLGLGAIGFIVNATSIQREVQQVAPAK